MMKPEVTSPDKPKEAAEEEPKMPWGRLKPDTPEVQKRQRHVKEANADQRHEKPGRKASAAASTSVDDAKASKPF